MSPEDAWRALSGFLDEQANLFDRCNALNHGEVPEELRARFIRMLDPLLRPEALAYCNRQAILAEWARCGSEEERLAVASNSEAGEEALTYLASDMSELVRREVVLNPSAGVELLVLLSDDQSTNVQIAFEMLRRRHAEVFQQLDDAPGETDTLDFLYSMVPAAEAEDLIEQLLEDQVREYAERLIRETQHADWVEPDLTDDPSRQVDADAPQPLSDAQVFSLLRHVLGARVF